MFTSHRLRQRRDRAPVRAVVSVASILSAAVLTVTPAHAHDRQPTHHPVEADRPGPDFDGDGRLDLAMAAFTDRDTESAVVIVDYSTGLPTEHLLPAGTDTTTGFGVGLATGDLDHDGYDDLVVGCSSCGWETGAELPVSLFRGSSGGLVRDTAIEPGGPVGTAVATGAVGPGDDDVDAIASTTTGDAATVTTHQQDRWRSNSYPVDPPIEAAEHTPTIAIGDVTGDGRDDLVVGTPRDDGGSITVFEGPVQAGPADQQTYPSDRFGADLGRFGAALVVTDLDGDGTDDIVVGAPGAAEAAGGTTCGAVVVIPGTGEPRRISQETHGVPGACEAGDLFGYDLAASDVDGDGEREIVVGVPGEDIGDIANAGSYTVLTCDLGIIDCTGSLGVTQNSPNVPGSPEAGDRFGFSVSAVDTAGNEAEDLLIGEPGESVGEAVHAGGVLVAVSDAAGAPGELTHDVSGDDYGVTDLGWSLA